MVTTNDSINTSPGSPKDSHKDLEEIGLSDLQMDAASISSFYPNEIRFQRDEALSLDDIMDMPDANRYQQKSNLGQGMLDLALLMANANQLRYLMESAGWHPYYYSNFTLIWLCIVLQIAVGFGLILNSRYNVNYEGDMAKANKINNMTVVGVFIITVVNVFTTLFNVASPPKILTGRTQVAAIQPRG